MSKELNYVCCQPDDSYFTWQVHLWLENLKELGHSSKAIVLIFTPSYREVSKVKWEPIIALYPEVTFAFYRDEHDMSKNLGIYIPLLRPYLLWRYWLDHPEMSERAVFYYDCDVLLTDKFTLEEFKDDDNCYLSDTNSYINASYFDSKIKDVLPDKVEEYKKIDVLDELTKLIGASRQIAEYYNNDSGGAQYLLKNIDAAFWKKVMDDCMIIRVYLMNINKIYFESESKGFQSWCADMWSILWNLWHTGHETMVIPEMAFAWGTDRIEKLETHTIYHNAGIVSNHQEGRPQFYKAKYHQGDDPMVDSDIDTVLTHPESRKYCTYFYAKKLDELRTKYKMKY